MSVSHPLSDGPPVPRRRNTAAYFNPKPEIHSGNKKKNPAALVVPTTEFGIRVEQDDVHDATDVGPGVGSETPMARTPVFTLTDGDEDPAGQIVLSTRWHTLSDQEIQANIATLSSVQSPSDESNHPYHDTIRILSAACERLVRQAAALERARRSLQQQEARRKRAAERAVKDLKPGQRDTGQQLLSAIYGLEPTEVPNHATLHPKTPNTIPKSLSEAMQEVWTPPAREQPALQPTPPLDIPPSPRNLSEASLSRSRASSFTPGSSSHSIRSDKTGASKSFLGGWFGRPVSIASEQEDPDDADVISVASGNVSITASGTATAKFMSGVVRKGRGMFNAFGIAPSPSPGSTSTPPREGTPQRRVEDLPDSDARSISALSHPGSPTAKLSSLPFQAPLMSPVLPAVTTFSTKAPSIAALSLDSADPPPPEPPLPAALVHPAEYLKQHGHPAHLHAITLATRVMTADPGSILADRGADTSKRVASGAVALVEGARRDGIIAYEPGRAGGKTEARKRSRSRGATPAPPRDEDEDDPERPTPTLASASLGRALAERDKAIGKSQGEGGTKASASGSIGAKFRSFSPMAVAALGTPLLAAFPRTSASSRPPPAPAPPSAVNPPAGPANLTAIPGPNAPKKPGRGTVELSAIVPVGMQPPTQFLSRAYTSSRLTSPTFRPQLASRFTMDETGEEGRSMKRLGMTDRYGFIYGASAYDVRLLQRARDASSTAPACLTGMKVQEQEDEETAVLDITTETQPDAEAEGEQVDTDMDRSLTASEILEPTKSSSSSNKSRPGSKRSPTMNVIPRAAAPVTTTSGAGAVASPPSTSTVRALLDQLTALHDTQQAAQKGEWDAFLKKRRQGGTFLGFIGAGEGDDESDEEREWGLGMVGVARMDGASGKEFLKLVRGGVPLVYRDKVWSECSGATEMREPGVFKELLSSHEGAESPILKEIEKDVVRTMPLNVFFGGDGVGVSKLRRVLQAYSWRNPEVGYCQGMNLIASTLLLVFPEEEDAFWVLVCVIEKLLPSEFFSGSLIDSRACPLVLLDYVEMHHPKIYAHLLDMGVDLPAICFSWFLSMYTDCLPVETLFRVWDLFFAEGLDALFRVGLAIVRMNEAELLACDSAPALYQYLEGMTGRMWQADKLMKVESEIKSLMTHGDLVRRRDAHVAMLQSYT